MQANKILSYLGLAMRAGKIASGEETVLKQIQSGRSRLVIMADDASDNTKKKFSDKCDFYHIPLIIMGTRDELGQSMGKARRVVISVMDEGFAKAMLKIR